MLLLSLAAVHCTPLHRSSSSVCCVCFGQRESHILSPVAEAITIEVVPNRDVLVAENGATNFTCTLTCGCSGTQLTWQRGGSVLPSTALYSRLCCTSKMSKDPMKGHTHVWRPMVF